MADSITSILEKFVRAQQLTIADVTTLVATRIYNAAPGRRGTYPCSVFMAIPLKDSKGQAGATIMSRFKVDMKIVTKGAPTDASEAAVAALFEHFKDLRAVVFGGYRISMRHDLPINLRDGGAEAEEFFYRRGGTFEAWLAPAL
jgi:hypothetical protein